jgi:hypothetical protein
VRVWQLNWTPFGSNFFFSSEAIAVIFGGFLARFLNENSITIQPAQMASSGKDTEMPGPCHFPYLSHMISATAQTRTSAVGIIFLCDPESFGTVLNTLSGQDVMVWDEMWTWKHPYTFLS